MENARHELVGFYHSHPKGKPIPSQEDISDAYWPDAIYVIAGLKRNNPSLAAWRIINGRVSSVGICTGKKYSEVASDEMSNAQKTAIIVGAVVVLAILIFVSLTLLPPAPPIDY